MSVMIGRRPAIINVKNVLSLAPSIEPSVSYTPVHINFYERRIPIVLNGGAAGPDGREGLILL